MRNLPNKRKPLAKIKVNSGKFDDMKSSHKELTEGIGRRENSLGRKFGETVTTKE